MDLPDNKNDGNELKWNDTKKYNIYRIFPNNYIYNGTNNHPNHTQIKPTQEKKIIKHTFHT